MPTRCHCERASSRIDRAGRALAGDLDARHLVPDLERQIEFGGRLAGAIAKSELRLAERLAAAGHRLDHADARAASAPRARARRARRSRRSAWPSARAASSAARPEHGEAAGRAPELGNGRGRAHRPRHSRDRRRARARCNPSCRRDRGRAPSARAARSGAYGCGVRPADARAPRRGSRDRSPAGPARSAQAGWCGRRVRHGRSPPRSPRGARANARPRPSHCRR